MSDRRPVRVRATEDGWKCSNRPCIKKPRNPLGSTYCTHCGCRFGAPYVIIGPPENSEASTSPEKSDATEAADTSENADSPENADTTGNADTTEKNDDKGKEKAD